ncbi:MAG: Rne/Rng family ribonuclease [Proteobacteria bacterium]|nr:Rne/Rng family ribonuclease [Pseudomonadota bacterium]
MSKKMLIDAVHPEETRVALLDEKGLLVDYEFKSSTKETVKGNIYLAKIMRVEPSLQAAFVDYGGGRHGFLAFGEIHPDYFRIPVADREALKAELAAPSDVLDEDDEDKAAHTAPSDDEGVSSLGGDLPPSDDEEEDTVKRPSLHRRYKIQEVVQKNQIILVQVVKEERGNKGAALTTYLSLAGRYCVLMPNSPRSGGISRKISNPADRKRLRQILEAFNVPDGMGLIIRTAGRERTRAELKRDGQYLMRLWDSIREKTITSIAPSLVHSEDDIVKRAVRDLYSKDVEQVLVSGEEGYKTAKDFMKSLMPSHSKRVQRYKSDRALLFHEYGVEKQIDDMYEAEVRLPSGGSIVLHPTEALVSIDINSGRATRERHIEETATKTNLEAATEIARQVRLRDLAGLIVIDFIDMDEPRNVAAVERRLREAFRDDRARIQMGRISPFGLMEMSRQRLAPSLLETSAHPCPHCQATGYIRSTESLALSALRILEDAGLRNPGATLALKLPHEVLLYVMNQKRHALLDVETRHGIRVVFEEAGPQSHACSVSVLVPSPTGALEVAPKEEPAPQKREEREEPKEAKPQPREPKEPRPERGNKRRRDRSKGPGDREPRERQDMPREDAPRPEPAPKKAETESADTSQVTQDGTDASQSPSESRKRRMRRRANRRNRDKSRQDTPDQGGAASEGQETTQSSVLASQDSGPAFPSTTIAASFDPNSPVFHEDAQAREEQDKEKTWWKRLLD